MHNKQKSNAFTATNISSHSDPKVSCGRKLIWLSRTITISGPQPVKPHKGALLADSRGQLGTKSCIFYWKENASFCERLVQFILIVDCLLIIIDGPGGHPRLSKGDPNRLSFYTVWSNNKKNTQLLVTFSAE